MSAARYRAGGLKPCISCGVVGPWRFGRCVPCEKERQKARNANPARRAAYLNPEYLAQPKTGICAGCGEVIEEVAATPADEGTRDHIVPVATQLALYGEVRDHRTQPMHRRCNSSRGAR